MNTIRSRRWFRRTFESLEARRLLTTFNVTTTIDRLDTADVTLAHPKGLDGKLSLREAIYLANLHAGPDTVVLKANSTYRITIAGANEDADATGDFDVTDDLTIKGSGSKSIIDGNGMDRVLDIPVDGISLSLDHVVVTGGITRVIGGGINGGLDETLTITNSTIRGNVATSPGAGLGGGIALESGDITLTNSHVDGNSAAAGTSGYGGGIRVDGGTGAITIKNSTVSGNTAYSGSGGIADGSSGAFTVVNSQINNNHAGGDVGGGVALYDSAPVTITNSTFSGNATASDGGALWDNTPTLITITGSTFNNNTAGDGGAVWTNVGNVIVSSSTFANNTSSGGDGGGIDNFAALTVTKSTFNHNIAAGMGGALAQGAAGDINISGSTFTQNVANNTSTDDGGGALITVVSGNTTTITDSKFTYNRAQENGGAIDYRNDIVILRSTFDHNTSVTGNGGALDGCAAGSPLTATDSTFTYNTSKADGGAIDSEENDITLTRCVVSNNVATNGQGGGFSDGTGGSSDVVNVTDSTISGNTAGGDGGGFSATGLTLTMSGSTLSGNRSGSDGGGAFIATTGFNPTQSVIANSTISGNGAADAGGGIEFEGDGQLVLIYDTIAFNSSFFGGGIVQSSGSGVIIIGDTIVARNNAPDGPEIHDDVTPFDDVGNNLFFTLQGQNTAGISTVIVGNNKNADNDIIGLDPKLGALANNGGPTKTHALLKGSPAINAGSQTGFPSTSSVDQRGVKRPQDGAWDIGAYEKK